MGQRSHPQLADNGMDSPSSGCTTSCKTVGGGAGAQTAAFSLKLQIICVGRWACKAQAQGILLEGTAAGK